MNAIYNSFLNFASVGAAYLFSTAEDPKLMQETPVFGPEEWRLHFKLDLTSPPIPESIQKALTEPCKFWPNKEVKETHLLYLVPDNLSILQLYELAGRKTNSPFINRMTEVAEKPYWVLITKKIIPNSQGLTFEKLNEAVTRYGYLMPSILEAVIAVVVAKCCKITIFPEVGSFTACNQLYDGDLLAVGSSDSVPFSIYTHDYWKLNGVAGVKRT